MLTFYMLLLFLFSSCSPYQKANMLVFSGEYEQGIDGYREILKQEPGNLLTWRKLGYALYLQGNYEEAIKAFDKTLSLLPDDPDATFYKGVCLLALDRRQEGFMTLGSYSDWLRVGMKLYIERSARDLETKGQDLPPEKLVCLMEKARHDAWEELWDDCTDGGPGGGGGCGSIPRLDLPLINPTCR